MMGRRVDVVAAELELPKNAMLFRYGRNWPTITPPFKLHKTMNMSKKDFT
jgi:hypothetical protein